MQGESPTFGQALGSRASPGPIGVPLFHAAWLFAAGVLLTQAVWLRPTLVLMALALLAVLACLAAFGAQRIVWLPLATLWLLLGAWCAEMEPHAAPAPTLAALSDGLLRTVEGTVVDTGPVRGEVEQNPPEDDNATPAETAAREIPALRSSQRIDLRLSSIEEVTDESDEQAPVTGGIRLTVRWPAGKSAPQNPRPFHCGERVRAVAGLLPPEVYHDPGVWSRQDFLLNQGVTSTASVTADYIERIGESRGAFLICRLGALQQAFSTRLLALPAVMRRLPAPLRLTALDAAMLAAMVAGDRTYLNHSLRVGFERTGSFHMLVVSGFHLAIVAACVLWMARRLRLHRVPATLITILASFAYALFTGFATPVQRSLWMIALYLVGRLLYRNRNPLNTIGFAALCLLAVSPRSLFDASLQMTLLAVIAIAGFAAPLLQSTVHPYLAATRDLRVVAIDPSLPAEIAQFRVTLRMAAVRVQAAVPGRFSSGIAWRMFPESIRFLLRLVELLVVSCAVELAMTLPMAVYFHRITLFALPVNLLILPLLAILMPAALLMLLALAIWPGAAVVPAIIVAVAVHIGIRIVHLFGSLTLGDFRIPSPLLWQSAAFCLLLGTAIVLAQLGVSGRSRRLRSAGCAALMLAALAAVAPRPVERPAGALLMEAIDVGQGDSLLLITPDGKTLLVDGGGFGGGPHQAQPDFDIGEEVVSQALWSRGIRHLDAVALTHAHSDHMGGLPAVLRNFHPGELWLGHNPRFAAYDALLEEAEVLNIRLRYLSAGDVLALGSARIGVLAPFPNYQPGLEPSNNDSLVLHVSYRDTSVLLEGDAEAPIEDEMIAEDRRGGLPGRGLSSTLLKVGHHGSITSTRPGFLSGVAPQWAVISCGLHNRYGHPRQEVLQELQSAHIRTYRTDINGAVCFRLDGKTAAPEPECGSR